MAPLYALLLAVGLVGSTHAPVRTSRTQQARHVLIAPVSTPLREDQLLDVLARTASPRAPRRRVLMTWALVALETGRGRFIHSNNLGNTGTTDKRSPRHRLRDGGTYESFATPTAGAVKLWRILTRCSSAMARFDAGDGIGAAYALRRCGYHRTDPGLYGAALRSLYYEVMTRWPVQARRVRRHRARPTLYARHEVNR